MANKNKNKNKNEDSAELTWDERNPKNYLYHSSKEIKWIRKEIKKEKKNNLCR